MSPKYCLYKHNQMLYECELTKKQADQANKRFEESDECYNFRMLTHKSSNKMSKDTNEGAWKLRYQQARGVARYPFDLIVSETMKEIRKASENLRVLDFGFGGGNHLWFLAKENCDTWGIDITEQAKEIALQTCKENGVVIDQEKLLIGKLDEISDLIPENAFDIIIDRQSLVQISNNEARDYANIFHKKLRKGGKYLGLLFSDDHPSVKEGNYNENGLYSSFKEGLFNGMGQRQLYSPSLIQDTFKNFKINAIYKHELNPVLGKECHEGTSEYLVIAEK